MASAADKMADDTNKMAAAPRLGRQPYREQEQQMTDMDEDMEIERPSTPLPSVGASKRHRCGCSPFAHCYCPKDATLLNKKFRPSSEDDEDLKSLDRFLASLHFNWQRCDYNYQVCPP